MRKRRASASEVLILEPEHPERRAQFEPLATDDLDAATAKATGFMREYLPEKFYHPFTEDQTTMIRDALQCAKYGGKQADAAPRFGGKTSLIEGLIIYGIVYGLLYFPVVLAATAKHGDRIVANIKHEFAANDKLAEDFPEVCSPIRALEGRPQRAISQTARRENGEAKPTMMKWGRDEAVFPTVEGSKASGAIIMAFGIDGAIRGVRYLNRRPDFVLIDDPETRESAKSRTQVEDRLQAIDRDVSGLGGPGKRIAQIALVTIQEHDSVADEITDRTRRPAWQGKRFKLVKTFPLTETADGEKRLWQDYIKLRHEDQQNGDRWARRAHNFYLDNRAAMDEGAEVSDPYRFVGEVLPDDSQVEVSTLQSYYNFVADNGEAAALSELQNDPPEESGPESSGISHTLVASRLHNYPHRFLPDDCNTLTIGVDVGIHRFHWVAIAWRPGAIGFIVDYDEHRVSGTSPEDTVQLTAEKAIAESLIRLRQQWIEEPFATETGEIVEPKLVMIDSGSGLHTEAVYQFVRSVGHRPFVAAKGFARGHGMTPFYAGKQSPTRRIGDHWFQARQDNSPDIWLHGFDADYWKRFVHQRFLTPTEDENGYRPGTLSLWRDPMSHRHTKFSKQIAAEIWTTIPAEGKSPQKEYWARQQRDNHYLDACAMACAAGSMAGIRIVGEAKEPTTRQSRVLVSAGGTRPDGRRWI